MVALGGETAWRVYRSQGGIGVAYHWIEGKPSMCLYPLSAMTIKPPGAYVIPQREAYRFAHSNGEPELDEAIPAAARACEIMGVHQTPAMLRHIVDAILDGLPDLIEMPPEPEQLKPVKPNVGEMAIKVDGETVMERTV